MMAGGAMCLCLQRVRGRLEYVPFWWIRRPVVQVPSTYLAPGGSTSYSGRGGQFLSFCHSVSLSLLLSLISTHQQHCITSADCSGEESGL